MERPKPGEILFLSRDDVRKALTARECFQRCLDTFRWVGEGKVNQANPLGLYLQPRDGPEPPFGYGVLQAYPAAIENLGFGGIKWLGSYMRNRERDLPVISAIDILNDIETAMPVAILDGTSITNMRTAGHAGVGAWYLARKNSHRLAMVGCGNEGETHLEVLSALFNIMEVRIFDIAPELMAAFQKKMAAPLGLKIKACPSAREAVKGADIVCVVTTAAEPVIMEGWMEPGCHVCACTGFRDIDIDCATKFDKWVVGWYGRDLVWIEGPEAGRMGGVPPGKLTKKDIYADLSTEIIPGKKPGREHTRERTMMTHLGMPALDVAVAALVYEKALEMGVGSLMKLFSVDPA